MKDFTDVGAARTSLNVRFARVEGLRSGAAHGVRRRGGLGFLGAVRSARNNLFEAKSKICIQRLRATEV